MVEGERDFYNGTTDIDHLPNAVPFETCIGNEIVSDSTRVVQFCVHGVGHAKDAKILLQKHGSFQILLSFPRIPRRSRKSKDPNIDYSHSHVITSSHDYILTIYYFAIGKSKVERSCRKRSSQKKN